MIIEDNGLVGIQMDLAHLDQVTASLGFVRWQWEYYRATYDCKFEDTANHEEYFLRINTRAVEGKLESPYAILKIEHVYIGRATFPHGLDYDSPIPDDIIKASQQRLKQLKEQLA